ncbi:MAG: mandelate racemase/muconate lactonizing enzyme family protein [Jatrophihabitans sp.]
MSARTTFLFFEVLTSTGRCGVGEATMSSDDSAAAATAQRWFDDHLAGSALADAPSTLDRIAVDSKAESSLVRATALSALEQCLLDLRGKVLGVPVYELLGGSRRSEIGLYANVNRGITDRSPEGFVAGARAAVDAGFTAVKCAPFDGVRPSDGPDARAIQFGLERLRGVRAAVGPETRLMADCHGRLSSDVVKAIVPALLDLGVFWLEEPLMSHPQMNAVIGSADGTPEIAYDLPVGGAPLDALDDAGIRLAGGEFEYGIERFESILRQGRLAYLMPDIKHCGGIWPASVIGAMAAAHGVRLSPHNPSGPVATMASMHVCATASNFEILEYQWGEVEGREALITPVEPRDGGIVRCADAPGLGCALDHDAIRGLEIPLD